MSLIIHPKTSEQLEKVLRQPPHALLIVAPTGAGKQAIGRHLIAKLLGVNEQKLQGNAVFITIEPEDGEAFGIDSVRQARHFMTLKSTKASTGSVQRVVLLPDAQRMTREAQNALLKLLEEPPEGSMLILTSSSEQAMLATIVSRCQVLSLSKPTPEQIVKALKENGHSDESIAMAMKISDGWPALATTIIDPEAEHPLARATEEARTVLQQQTFDRLCRVDTLAKNRELCVDMCYILQQMAHLALQNSSTTGAVERWQRVMTAAYRCQETLQARVNTKLAVTQLMLSL